MMDHITNSTNSFNLNAKITRNLNTAVNRQNSIKDVNTNNVNLNHERIEKLNPDYTDYFTEKQISTLAEKFEKYHIYTKEASKIVAEQIIKGATEFFA